MILFELYSGIASRIHSDIETTGLKFADILCIIVLYLRPFQNSARFA